MCVASVAGAGDLASNPQTQRAPHQGIRYAQGGLTSRLGQGGTDLGRWGNTAAQISYSSGAAETR